MDTFYNILKSSHSGWRWIVLVLLVVAVVKMHIGWKKKKDFTSGDKKLALFAMVAFHIQFLFGWVLFFVSPKVLYAGGGMGDKLWRFFTVEHSLMMVIAMILLTMGNAKLKRKKTSIEKFKTVAIFYTIALVIILAAIPWPFREALGAGWM